MFSAAQKLVDIDLTQLDALDTMLVEIERQQQSLFLASALTYTLDAVFFVLGRGRDHEAVGYL